MLHVCVCHDGIYTTLFHRQYVRMCRWLLIPTAFEKITPLQLTMGWKLNAPQLMPTRNQYSRRPNQLNRKVTSPAHVHVGARLMLQ